MTTTKIADYLFKRVKDLNVEYTFGIPGDFVLPHYVAQARNGLKTIVMTHEPSVGYAADAYARLQGLGVALVTYCVGGLNMVNATGLAYAEQSPLLVISGGPETKFRQQKAQLHHCIKTFETQYLVYNQVTESSVILNNPALAQEQIDNVIDTTIKTSRPGYIELPRDLVNQEITLIERAPSSVTGESQALNEVVSEIVQRISAAKQPVLLIGVEISRFRLTDDIIAMVNKLNLPVVTATMGKSAFPETHPNFIGNYFGKFGNENVREFVESSDCIISLGAILTEMETGGYTAKLDPSKLILANTQEVLVAHHSYGGLQLPMLVNQLTQAVSKLDNKFTVPAIATEQAFCEPPKDKLTVTGIISFLNSMLSEKYSVVTDVGDCLYAGLNLKTDSFIAPGYYSSMGFGVPAGIGAQLGDKSRRPIVLVGDGGFQMTGMEISTAAKFKLNPIIIVLNNASYAMLAFFDKQRDYYDLPTWDYVAIAKACGADGARATTSLEFQNALQSAAKSDVPYLIDAVIARNDISPTLRRLTEHFGSKVKSLIG